MTHIKKSDRESNRGKFPMNQTHTERVEVYYLD